MIIALVRTSLFGLALLVCACSPASAPEVAAAAVNHPPVEALRSDSGARRALLIGIDDYLVVSDLAGTGNDVALMQRVLTSKLKYEPSDIVTLQNEAATREGIISAFRTHLIEKSKAGDHVFIHYSGHGSQMIDTDGDEIDDLDETIVPYDSRTEGVFDISDDELNTLLAELAAKTTNITVVLDSCHSGSGTRDGARVRQVPKDKRQPPASSWARGSAPVGVSDFREMGANFVLITGAATFELANETTVNGHVFGVMTYHLANTLLGLSSTSTFKDVIDLVRNKVTATFPTQHPQLEGTAPDRLVYGDGSVAAEPYALVSPTQGDRVHIDHGELHGVRSDQVLTVYPPGTKNFEVGSGTAQIRVENTDVFEADARIISGSVMAASRTPVGAFVRGDHVVSVWVAPDVDSSEAIGNAIEKDPGFHVADKQEEAQLSVVSSTAGWQLVMGDLTPLGAPLSTEEEVTAKLAQWGNWFSVLHRSNRKPTGGISIRMQRDEDPIGSLAPDQIEPGDILKFKVRNDTSEPLHITVISLSTSGNIEPLYYSESQRLPPGSELPWKRVGTGLPDGMNESVDFFKVFASKSNIHPQVFTAASVSSKDGFALDSVDWLSDMVSVRLKREPTRAEGFVIVLDDATRATTRSGTTARSVCSPGTSNCISGEPMSEAGDVLFVSPATRSPTTDTFAPGAAFQGAYDIGRDYAVKRVEPMFNVYLVDDQLERQTRGGGDDVHDPAAAADHFWSLKYVKATEARQTLRDLGKPAGAEARGIYVAHLDTGYRHHPEVWNELYGERPILPEWGLDLVQNDDDPFDDLRADGVLPNPGHGTASGSVIVSPDGCQLADAEEPCMTGASPGAQLIPVRVHTSVVVLNQRRLAEAIYAVADKKVGGDPPLISIAMGGPPSWSLWKAVKRARDRGIAIIAAAGNNVKFVVWPARFKDTIAVGAVNIRCKPWSGSSEGRRVDISAPGESVWRAGVVTDTQDDFIGMSKGTTYATATTTGVAALWLAKNSGSAELENIRDSGQLVNTLRAALKSTAWRPGSDGAPAGNFCEGAKWNQHRNGAGIVDASALLERPISGTSVTRTIEPAKLDDLPLFASIYDDSAELGQIRLDFLNLFASTDLDSVARYEVEILFHYTASERLRAALDEVTSGATEPATFEMVRGILLEQDLSKDLRTALVEAQT